MKTLSHSGSLPLLALLLLALFLPTEGFTSNSRVATATTNQEPTKVPVFYLAKWVNQCKLDSPEILYENRIFPSVELFLQEGRVFFSLLTERLNSSLAGAEKYEYLEKEWRFLVNVINESFDLALDRIDAAWYGLIDSSDAIKLPWEQPWALPMLLEQFHKILEEYQVLEAVFKAGTKEIIGTLQNYLIDVFEKLEENMFYDPKDLARASKGMDLVRRMEKSIDKLEPNFMGNLMKKLVRTAAVSEAEAGDYVEPVSTVDFFVQPQEDIMTVMDFFRERSQDQPTFWADMTTVFKRVYGSIEPSSAEALIELYSNDEHLIELVISLLSVDLS